MEMIVSFFLTKETRLHPSLRFTRSGNDGDRNKGATGFFRGAFASSRGIEELHCESKRTRGFLMKQLPARDLDQGAFLTLSTSKCRTDSSEIAGIQACNRIKF